ncbi:hypothetical protein GCM10028804_40000 [Larkinella terrae]
MIFIKTIVIRRYKLKINKKFNKMSECISTSDRTWKRIWIVNYNRILTMINANEKFLTPFEFDISIL